MEELMKTLFYMLATAACVGLAAPSFAASRASATPSGPQLTQSAASDVAEFSSQEKAKKKKKKKKGTTSRSSWGG